jgi:hypothetical protein
LSLVSRGCLGTRRIDWYHLGKRGEPQPETA